MTEPTSPATLTALLGGLPGLRGAVTVTAEGELTQAIGEIAEPEATAAAACVVAASLAAIGDALGLGAMVTATARAPRAAWVLAQRAGVVVAITGDLKLPLPLLEAKLPSVTMHDPTAGAASEDEPPAEGAEPGIHRAPTLELPEPAAPAVPEPLPEPPLDAPPVRPTPLPSAQPARVVAAIPHAPSRPIRSPLHHPPTKPAVAIGSSPVVATPEARARAETGRGGLGAGGLFTGDLEEFGIPDLLELLRHSQRTGQLTFTTPAGTGAVRLSRGLVVDAESPRALGLRDALLALAELRPEERTVLLALPPEAFRPDRILQDVVARDLVTRDVVERARAARIYSAFREMIHWTTGRFSFDPAVASLSDPRFALSTQTILLQIYQEQDEQGR